MIQQFTTDTFDPTKASNIMKISNNRRVVSKTTSFNNTSNIHQNCGYVFGRDIVSMTDIMKWRLKLTKIQYLIPSVNIGICAIDEIDKFITNFITNREANKMVNWYVLSWNGHIFHGYSDKGKYCDQLKLCDIVEMHLYMEHMTVMFKLNGKDLGVAFYKVDQSKQYHLFVGLSHKDQIEILD